MDKMYTKHKVNQELKSYDLSLKPKRSRCAKDLSIFSCNTCKKVFHSESHMRVHCLSHTTLKPFSCLECDFSSNSKGSLQTHMRIHTGNIFACDCCPFKTGNTGHLREHMETHSAIAVKCKLCRNSYKNRKSLRNHVLRYHRSSAGKKYLSSFRSQSQCSMATLHLCEVCNKKFKKKSDRDHHQLSHNANAEAEPNQNCGSGPTEPTNTVVIHELDLVSSSSEKTHHPRIPTRVLEKQVCSPELGGQSESPTSQISNSQPSLDSISRLTNVEPDNSSSVLDEESIHQRNSSLGGCEMDVIKTAIFTANLEYLFEKESCGKSNYVSVQSEEVPSSQSQRVPEDCSPTCQPDSHTPGSGTKQRHSKLITPCNQSKERAVYQCPDCQRAFKRSSKDLQRHMQLHRRNSSGLVKIHPKNTDPPNTRDSLDAVQECWPCPWCRSSFQDQETLNQHLRIHVTPSSSAIGSPISSQDTLKEQVAVHRVEQSKQDHQSETVEKHFEEDGQQMYSCLGCCTTYLSFWDIHNHLKEKHGILLDVAEAVNSERTPLQEPVITTSST